MNFIKKLFFSLAMVCFVVLYAQNQSEKKAKSILDAVSINYKSKKTIYFKFTYTANSKSAKNHTGVFYASKDKYRLKLMDTEQIFDGNKVYNINKDEQEVTIAKPSGSEMMLSPVSYLDSYKKGYSIAYVGKKNNQELVRLKPIKNNGTKQVLLYINTSKKQIEKIEQYSDKNVLTSIVVNEYKENLNLSSTMFSFDKNLYRNYLITEL